MRLEVTALSGTRAGEELVVRAVVVNDSYVPVTLSRNAFIGPTPAGLGANGMPPPASVEPTYGQAEELVTLQPFTLYGRDRVFDGLPPGAHEFVAAYGPFGAQAEPLRAVAVVTVTAAPAGGGSDAPAV
jgi:hypothetical protein